MFAFTSRRIGRVIAHGAIHQERGAYSKSFTSGIALFSPQNPRGLSMTANYVNRTSIRGRHTLPHNTGVVFVPQQEAWVVERMGKFYKTLEPGVNFLVPLIDRIRYVQSLKEMAFEIPQQAAVTSDNVTLSIDGVLYLQIFDPYKTSYNVEDPEFSVIQLAQTSMRSEIGKIQLDSVFRERESLNTIIVSAINNATNPWGISCLRYEIRDIKLPDRVQEAMQLQVEAERKKRAQILTSEGARDAEINVAQGQANAIIVRAKAKAEALTSVANALNADAAAFIIAEQYVKAFSNLAKTNNTLIIPSDASDVNKMVAQAFQVYKSLSNSQQDGRSIHSAEDASPDEQDSIMGDFKDLTKANSENRPASVLNGKTKHNTKNKRSPN